MISLLLQDAIVAHLQELFRDYLDCKPRLSYHFTLLCYNFGEVKPKDMGMLHRML